MHKTRAFKLLPLLAIVGVLVVTVCTIQLRAGEDVLRPQKAEQTTKVTSSDLARCRSVTADETAGYQRCRQVWAENRRRFLSDKTGAAVSGQKDPFAALAPVTKDQSRIPQGYPQPATQNAGKP